jgi:arginase family enzyme
VFGAPHRRDLDAVDLLRPGVPFSVGGEHTITHPALKALGEDRPLGVVHLDAHPDT